MAPPAYGRLTEIPEGPLGALATLRMMADMIRDPDPGLLDFVEGLRQRAEAHGLTETETARWLFDWTRQRFVYVEDADDRRGGEQWVTEVTGHPAVEEVIQNPGASYAQMLTHGQARGDCDDYVVWLGALYYWLGFPVALVAVATHPDRQLDHVYLRVEVDGRWQGADAIPEAAGIFGWEPPEITARVEWQV